MSSSKNPENEAEMPAPMPHTRQAHRQPESGKKGKMASQSSAPPELEQVSQSNAIPFEKRTEDDNEMARQGTKG